MNDVRLLYQSLHLMNIYSHCLQEAIQKGDIIRGFTFLWERKLELAPAFQTMGFI